MRIVYSAKIREVPKYSCQLREVKMTARFSVGLFVTGTPIMLLSQTEYELLPVKDPNMYYFIRG